MTNIDVANPSGTEADPFDLSSAPGIELLDKIEGYEPIVVEIRSSAERIALRDRTLDASETATLFQSVSSTHPLDEENEEDGDQMEDEEGEPISPYATLYGLSLIKSGRVKVKRVFGGQTDRLMWSRILRPIVVQRVAESRGWRLRSPEWAYQHADVPKLSCSIQWEADINGSGAYVPLEPKVVGGSERWKWQNAQGSWVIPIPTQIRCQHIMSVTGARRVMVVALFGGNEERVFEVPRDEDLITEINEASRDFWTMIDAGEIPEPNYGRDSEMIRMLYAKIDPEKFLDWTNNNEAKMLVASKADHKDKENHHKLKAKECDDRLRELMGDASGADLGDAILGVVTVPGGEVSYYRDDYTRLQVKKPRKKHAGNAPKSSKKEK